MEEHAVELGLAGALLRPHEIPHHSPSSSEELMSLENYKEQKGEGVCSFRYEIEVVDGLRGSRRVFLTQRELVPLSLLF